MSLCSWAEELSIPSSNSIPAMRKKGHVWGDGGDREGDTRHPKLELDELIVTSVHCLYYKLKYLHYSSFIHTALNLVGSGSFRIFHQIHNSITNVINIIP